MHQFMAVNSMPASFCVLCNLKKCRWQFWHRDFRREKNFIAWGTGVKMVFFATLLSPVLDGFEWLLSLSTVHQQLINEVVIKFQHENFNSVARIKLWPAEWEAQTLPLCYAGPLVISVFGILGELGFRPAALTLTPIAESANATVRRILNCREWICHRWLRGLHKKLLLELAEEKSRPRGNFASNKKEKMEAEYLWSDDSTAISCWGAVLGIVVA